MPVVQGAAEAARQLSAYLTVLATCTKALAEWERQRNDHEAKREAHERAVTRYLRDLEKWNVDRGLGEHVGARPVNPGLAPPPFAVPRPAGPPATPHSLHHQVYGNTTGELPRASRGQTYHEAQVGSGRDGGRGQHRVVVLADDATGNVVAKYCTSDHYGDNARSTRPSFTKF